ncbi:hypothetical protein IMZ31_22370 (plasmid) [Pontibacillus sp. ALD_SL1]|uniref:hypothetical protein n=1 Tax=Pontibacillus sp. ALD_SL1 TaxID=2777185 RepID=UPI001A974800|nr:hypothetical protein [Pontibacillus sp. ALD_SL1]QST02201.1 hypothetical protein IMZ31_22370 [Pontibacillus sp. ALD_SL1]
MNIIAWAAMTELEDGITKTKIKELLSHVPPRTEIIPFNLDESGLLQANTLAHGFCHNDHYDDFGMIAKKMAEICNDMEKEREDNLYPIDEENGFLLIY